MTHDYEAVHSATEAEEAGVFKNCDFLDQDKAAASSCADLARLRGGGGGSVASSRWPVEMTPVPRRQTTTTAPAATQLPDIELRPGL